VLGLFAASIVALTLWVVVERRVDEPMIDMRMFMRRPVLLTNVAGILAGFSMFGAFVLIANFIQSSPEAGGYGFGASSTVTGLYLLPNTIFGLFGGVLANLIGSRFGSKIPMAIGMLNAGLGIGIVALWHTSAWQIVLGMIVFGAGVPMAFAAMAKLIVDAVRPTETGVAGGMNTVTRLIGGVIGGQVGAVMLTTDTIPGTSVPAESAFTYAFAAAALVAVLGGVLSLFATPVRRRTAIPALETE
jgi:MFS family permease